MGTARQTRSDDNNRLSNEILPGGQLNEAGNKLRANREPNIIAKEACEKERQLNLITARKQGNTWEQWWPTSVLMQIKLDLGLALHVGNRGRLHYLFVH